MQPVGHSTGCRVSLSRDSIGFCSLQAVGLVWESSLQVRLLESGSQKSFCLLLGEKGSPNLVSFRNCLKPFRVVCLLEGAFLKDWIFLILKETATQHGWRWTTDWCALSWGGDVLAQLVWAVILIRHYEYRVYITKRQSHRKLSGPLVLAVFPQPLLHCSISLTYGSILYPFGPGSTAVQLTDCGVL